MGRNIRRGLVGAVATTAAAFAFMGSAAAAPTSASSGGVGSLPSAGDRAVSVASASSAGDVSTKEVPHGSFVADGVNIRTGPGVGYTSIGAGYSGQAITVHCWFGSAGDWWHITNRATGVKGWVYWAGDASGPYVLLDYASPEPPQC